MALLRGLMGLLLGKRLPLHAGELTIPGPRQRITIRRDQFGLAMIEAENDRDAAFAVGFCQGQDRRAQLELLQRVGRGTLAEWVGPEGLAVDRMSRRIGFARAAEAQWPILNPEVREALIAFSEGINAATEFGLPKKPHEFSLIGGEPTPWQPQDTLAYLKLISFSLPANWDAELARLMIALHDGDSALSAWERRRGPELAQRLQQDIAAFREWMPVAGGSNNWVISGERTASGKPLLANDPHLPATLPAPWYLVHIRTPEWAVAGATFVGAPAVICGHNGTAAWGVTAGLTDQCDLFLESEPDANAPQDTLRETIVVKGQADHVEEIRITARGPVITPLIPGLTIAVSLRAVWLDPLPVRGFFDLPRVRNFEEFREVFREWPGLPLNVVYADHHGTTGYQMIGQLPRRPNAASGLVPTPTNRPWQGLLDHEQLVYLKNPQAGYYATANEHPSDRGALDTHGDPSAFLGCDFLEPLRGMAIRQELGARKGWDVPACLALQTSVRCVLWEQIRERVLRATQQQKLHPLLSDWNGHATADSPAAAVYELMLIAWVEQIARQELPTAARAALGKTAEGLLGSGLFNERYATPLLHWLETTTEDQVDKTIVTALSAASNFLTQELGPSPHWWAWGEVRRLELSHSLMGTVKALRSIFQPPAVAHGGDHFTINQAGVSFFNVRKPVSSLPNLRMVLDCGDWSASRVVLCGGQSGNPMSRNYLDQYEYWLRGEAVPLRWTPEEILRTTLQTLRINPLAHASDERKPD